MKRNENAQALSYSNLLEDIKRHQQQLLTTDLWQELKDVEFQIKILETTEEVYKNVTGFRET